MFQNQKTILKSETLLDPSILDEECCLRIVPFINSGEPWRVLSGESSFCHAVLFTTLCSDSLCKRLCCLTDRKQVLRSRAVLSQIFPGVRTAVKALALLNFPAEMLTTIHVSWKVNCSLTKQCREPFRRCQAWKQDVSG